MPTFAAVYKKNQEHVIFAGPFPSLSSLLEFNPIPDEDKASNAAILRFTGNAVCADSVDSEEIAFWNTNTGRWELHLQFQAHE